MAATKLLSMSVVNLKVLYKAIDVPEYFLRHPSQIGGSGHPVEIDESAFVHRKYNRRHQVNTQWMFGGIDVNTKDFASSASGACIAWDHGYIRFMEGIFNSLTYWI